VTARVPSVDVTGKPALTVPSFKANERGRNTMQENTMYLPPALAEVGEFAQVTLGRPVWGFDSRDRCVFFNCDD
jgi:hypothetical protein